MIKSILETEALLNHFGQHAPGYSSFTVPVTRDEEIQALSNRIDGQLHGRCNRYLLIE